MMANNQVLTEDKNNRILFCEYRMKLQNSAKFIKNYRKENIFIWIQKELIFPPVDNVENIIYYHQMFSTNSAYSTASIII